jgi:hypothetical protein
LDFVTSTGTGAKTRIEAGVAAAIGTSAKTRTEAGAIAVAKSAEVTGI